MPAEFWTCPRSKMLRSSFCSHFFWSAVKIGRKAFNIFHPRFANQMTVSNDWLFNWFMSILCVHRIMCYFMFTNLCIISLSDLRPVKANPSRLIISGISVIMKINLNFYFHASLCVLQKLLWRPSKLIFCFRPGSGWERLKVSKKPLLYENLEHGFHFYQCTKKIM